MTVQELGNAAWAARQRGDLSEALACWRKVLAIDPEHVDAHAHSATVLLELGEAEKAECLLREAVRRWPQSALPYAGLAWVARHHRRLDEALECWRQVAAIEPSPQVDANAAIVLMELGRNHEAKALLSKAVDRWPEDPDAYVGLAWLAVGEGDWEAALGHWRRTSELDPDNVAARVQAANVLAKMDRRDEAHDILARAAERWPQHPEPHAGLAYAARARNNLHQALASWRKVAELAPGRVDATVQMAQIASDLGDYEQARSLLMDAVTRWPEDPEVLAARARLAATSHQPEPSPELARQLAAVDPDSTDVAIAVSRALAECGRPDDAARVLDSAMERWPEHPEPRAERARLAERTCDWQQALAHWQWIADLGPDRAEVIEARTRIALIRFEQGFLSEAQGMMADVLRRWPNRYGALAGAAWLAERSQDWQHALECWQAVVRQSPDDLKATAHIGEMLLRLGRLETAEQKLSQALETNPGNPSLLSPLAAVRVAGGRNGQALETLSELLSSSALSMRVEGAPVSRQGRRAAVDSPPVEDGGTMLVATSLAPRRTAVQRAAVASWLKAGMSIRSLNSGDEIRQLADSYPEALFVEAPDTAKSHFGIPLVFLDDVLSMLEGSGAEICGFINSDIVLEQREGFTETLQAMAPDEVVFCRRVDLYDGSDSERPFFDGVDAVFFRRQAIRQLVGSNLVIGAPWWDLWVPLVALAKAMTVKQITTPVLYHTKHATAWNARMYQLCGFQTLYALNRAIPENGGISSIVGPAVRVACAEPGKIALIPELFWNAVIEREVEKVVL